MSPASPASHSLAKVLLVESNPADAYLMVEALKQAGLSGDITVADDSKVALDRLRREQPPDLVMLDLNVAPLSGLDLLREMRRDPRLNAVPVIMVSGSENHEDIRNAYRCGANCYINKTARLDEFMRIMKTCYEFWGTVVTLPPK